MNIGEEIKKFLIGIIKLFWNSIYIPYCELVNKHPILMPIKDIIEGMAKTGSIIAIVIFLIYKANDIYELIKKFSKSKIINYTKKQINIIFGKRMNKRK